MHFVINQVVQLQHIHDANRDRPIKRIPRATIKQGDLAAFIHVCQSQHILDLSLCSTIKNRCRHRHARSQIGGQLTQFLF